MALAILATCLLAGMKFHWILLGAVIGRASAPPRPTRSR
jgi:hypothetical protein